MIYIIAKTYNDARECANHADILPCTWRYVFNADSIANIKEGEIWLYKDYMNKPNKSIEKAVTYARHVNDTRPNVRLKTIQ